MRSLRGTGVAGLCLVLAACSSGFAGGPMVKLNGPTGGFGDTHGTGYTLGAQGELRLITFSVYGDAALSRFSGNEDNGVEFDDINVWELALGGRLFFGPIHVGGQYGYAKGDLDQQLIRPEVGVRLGKLNAFAQYQLNHERWWSLGGALTLF
jgi:hypothetical protein